MESPPVDHDNGILGDEVISVPVVFDVQVILTEFIYWSPSEDFLEFNQGARNAELQLSQGQTLMIARM